MDRSWGIHNHEEKFLISGDLARLSGRAFLFEEGGGRMGILLKIGHSRHF